MCLDVRMLCVYLAGAWMGGAAVKWVVDSYY